jgi:hypothetical protein
MARKNRLCHSQNARRSLAAASWRVWVHPRGQEHLLPHLQELPE